jgi:hypothetical protein
MILQVVVKVAITANPKMIFSGIVSIIASVFELWGSFLDRKRKVAMMSPSKGFALMMEIC